MDVFLVYLRLFLYCLYRSRWQISAEIKVNTLQLKFITFFFCLHLCHLYKSIMNLVCKKERKVECCCSYMMLCCHNFYIQYILFHFHCSPTCVWVNTVYFVVVRLWFVLLKRYSEYPEAQRGAGSSGHITATRWSADKFSTGRSPLTFSTICWWHRDCLDSALRLLLRALPLSLRSSHQHGWFYLFFNLQFEWAHICFPALSLWHMGKICSSPL